MSPTDSPRESCISSPRRTTGWPPSSATPTSKEIRVRVEGRSKTRATLRPASESAPSAACARGRLSARRRGRAACRARRRPSSSPVRKSRVAKPRILRAMELTVHRLEPLPRPRLPARPRAAHLALAPAAPRRAQRDPRPGQPRPDRRSSRRCSPAPPGTWRCCRSARRASPSRWRGACGAECAPGAHLAQRARRRCARCWRARTRT